MGVTVKVNLNPVKEILAGRNLDGKAQLVMANAINRLSQPYIPFDRNPLSTTVTIDEKSITYSVPYARYQYYGVAMSGNPRQPNGKALNYQGSPMRGAKWTERMVADRIGDVVKEVAKEIGGRAE